MITKQMCSTEADASSPPIYSDLEYNSHYIRLKETTRKMASLTFWFRPEREGRKNEMASFHVVNRMSSFFTKTIFLLSEPVAL